MADPTTIARLRAMYAQALARPQPQIVPMAALQRPMVPTNPYPGGTVPMANVAPAAAPGGGFNPGAMAGIAPSMGPMMPGGNIANPALMRALMMRYGQPQVPQWSGAYPPGQVY